MLCVCVQYCVHKSVYIWISGSTCPETVPRLQLGVYLVLSVPLLHIYVRVFLCMTVAEESLCKCASVCLSRTLSLHLCVCIVYPCAHVCPWDCRCWESQVMYSVSAYPVCILTDGVGLCFCRSVSMCVFLPVLWLRLSGCQPWPLLPRFLLPPMSTYTRSGSQRRTLTGGKTLTHSKPAPVSGLRPLLRGRCLEELEGYFCSQHLEDPRPDKCPGTSLMV